MVLSKVLVVFVHFAFEGVCQSLVLELDCKHLGIVLKCCFIERVWVFRFLHLHSFIGSLTI